jgi:glutamate carboxypeptidase
MDNPSASSRLAMLRLRTSVMVEQVESLVCVETPSTDLDACARGAEVVAALGAELLGTGPERLTVGGRRHLRWRFGRAGGSGSADGSRTGVVLIGHFDTVWPMGTVADWPFAVDADAGTATGPGSLDMKAGIVQLFHALSTLDDLDGVEILLTSDEELGSPTSRVLVEEAGRRAAAALVLEGATPDGSVKIARKGAGMYGLRVTGRAAHAGVEPEKGANALVELAHLVLAAQSIARPELGSTVTPTMATAGTATNVIPAAARLNLDVRVSLPEEADRIDRALRAITPTVPGTVIAVEGGPNRPPLPPSSSAGLFYEAQLAADRLGLPKLDGVGVGGASDGNFTAAVGCPTLDGLGPVGRGAHAAGEHIVIAAMPERAALVAELVVALL